MNDTPASLPTSASVTVNAPEGLATPPATAMEQLDIAVHNLDGPASENDITHTFRTLPGIGAVRIIERGIWLQYRPESITPERIIHALREAGYDAALFQDSASGATGRVRY